MVGFTDGDGTFCVSRQGKKWALTFQISQNKYNLRILYFIKRQLGAGTVFKEMQTNMACYRMRDRGKLNLIIFPIFDKYPLLTSKHYSYNRFKQAYAILSDPFLLKVQKHEQLLKLLNVSLPINFIAPVWGKIGNVVEDTKAAVTVVSKAWLVGFVEAEGSFYLIKKAEGRIVHAFEITQKLDLIVLQAISHMLGIRTKANIHGFNSVGTANSRAIENVIKYFVNTMKGMKSFEYRIWARTYVKHKGDFEVLKKIQAKMRLRRIRGNVLEK